MSNIENEYLYTRQLRQDTPAWYRLERYDYCDFYNKNAASGKRGIFSRFADRKRRK